MSASGKNLNQRILAVMSSSAPLIKDLEVKYKQTAYQAASINQVISSVRQGMIENGIIIIPEGQKREQDGNMTILEVTWRIQNVDDGDDFKMAQTTGYGQDYSDKGPGKALTYAQKILLKKLFMIPDVSEDTDQYAELPPERGRRQERSDQRPNTPESRESRSDHQRTPPSEDAMFAGLMKAITRVVDSLGEEQDKKKDLNSLYEQVKKDAPEFAATSRVTQAFMDAYENIKLPF